MINNRLKVLRSRHNIKQDDLAKILSVSQSTISGWESGRYEIDNYNLCKIAEYFNVSIDYLLYNEGRIPSSIDNSIDLTKILDRDSIYFEDKLISASDKELLHQILQRFFGP